jgi:hypothetical protein
MLKSSLLLCLAMCAATAAQASPITGLWEGTYDGPRGDQALAMVARPRGDTGFAGTFYLEGAELGPIERGAVRGDSLSFHVADYDFLGQAPGDKLALARSCPTELRTRSPSLAPAPTRRPAALRARGAERAAQGVDARRRAIRCTPRMPCRRIRPRAAPLASSRHAAARRRRADSARHRGVSSD